MWAFKRSIFASKKGSPRQLRERDEEQKFIINLRGFDGTSGSIKIMFSAEVVVKKENKCHSDARRFGADERGWREIFLHEKCGGKLNQWIFESISDDATWFYKLPTRKLLEFLFDLFAFSVRSLQHWTPKSSFRSRSLRRPVVALYVLITAEDCLRMSINTHSVVEC